MSTVRHSKPWPVPPGEVIARDTPRTDNVNKGLPPSNRLAGIPLGQCGCPRNERDPFRRWTAVRSDIAALDGRGQSLQRLARRDKLLTDVAAVANFHEGAHHGGVVDLLEIVELGAPRIARHMH